MTVALTHAPYRGVFPIVPTPFTDSGDLDIDSQRRVIDCKEGGVIASDAARHLFAPLPEASRNGLFELVRALEPLALRWGL